MSRPRSAPAILALGKLGACVTLPSIDLDSCLHLKILRRHSIGNKERRAEQSFCLLQLHKDDNQFHLERFGFQIGCNDWCFRSISQCSRFLGMLRGDRNAASGCWSKRGMWGVCKWGLHIWTSIFCPARCESRPVAVVRSEDAMSHARM